MAELTGCCAPCVADADITPFRTKLVGGDPYIRVSFPVPGVFRVISTSSSTNPSSAKVFYAPGGRPPTVDTDAFRSTGNGGQIPVAGDWWMKWGGTTGSIQILFIPTYNSTVNPFDRTTDGVIGYSATYGIKFTSATPGTTDTVVFPANQDRQGFLIHVPATGPFSTQSAVRIGLGFTPDNASSSSWVLAAGSTLTGYSTAHGCILLPVGSTFSVFNSSTWFGSITLVADTANATGSTCFAQEFV